MSKFSIDLENITEENTFPEVSDEVKEYILKRNKEILLKVDKGEDISLIEQKIIIDANRIKRDNRFLISREEKRKPKTGTKSKKLVGKKLSRVKLVELLEKDISELTEIENLSRELSLLKYNPKKLSRSKMLTALKTIDIDYLDYIDLQHTVNIEGFSEMQSIKQFLENSKHFKTWNILQEQKSNIED